MGVIHLHLKMNTLTIVTVAQHSEIHVVRMDCKYLTLEKRNKNTHHCPRIPIFVFCRIPIRRNHIRGTHTIHQSADPHSALVLYRIDMTNMKLGQCMRSEQQ